MNNATQLIVPVRPRSHQYGLFLTGRFRDLLTLEDTRSLVDLSLVKAARRFEPERGIPFFFFARVWIRRDLAKHVKRQISRRDSLSPAPTNEPTTLHSTEDHVLVQQLLSRLNSTERDVVRQHIFEGKSLAQVARLNDRHRAWACRTLKRALGNLRLFMN